MEESRQVICKSQLIYGDPRRVSKAKDDPEAVFHCLPLHSDPALPGRSPIPCPGQAEPALLKRWGSPAGPSSTRRSLRLRRKGSVPAMALLHCLEDVSAQRSLRLALASRLSAGGIGHVGQPAEPGGGERLGRPAVPGEVPSKVAPGERSGRGGASSPASSPSERRERQGGRAGLVGRGESRGTLQGRVTSCAADQGQFCAATAMRNRPAPPMLGPSVCYACARRKGPVRLGNQHTPRPGSQRPPPPPSLSPFAKQSRLAPGSEGRGPLRRLLRSPCAAPFPAGEADWVPGGSACHRAGQAGRKGHPGLFSAAASPPSPPPIFPLTPQQVGSPCLSVCLGL